MAKFRSRRSRQSTRWLALAVRVPAPLWMAQRQMSSFLEHDPNSNTSGRRIVNQQRERLDANVPTRLVLRDEHEQLRLRSFDNDRDDLVLTRGWVSSSWRSMLAVLYRGELRIFDTDTERTVEVALPGGWFCSSASISPDGSMVAVALNRHLPEVLAWEWTRIAEVVRAQSSLPALVLFVDIASGESKHFDGPLCANLGSPVWLDDHDTVACTSSSDFHTWIYFLESGHFTRISETVKPLRSLVPSEVQLA
jgi:hypothetical protein